jgi:hypothetical protein
METSSGGGGIPPESNFKEGSTTNDFDGKYLAKISTLPSGPAYADQNFGGDPEKGGTRGSYNADSVVLTLEFLSDRGAKFLILLLRMSIVLSFALLIVQLWWKMSNDATTLAYNDTIILVNLIVAVGSVLLLLLAGGFYLFGIYKAIKLEKKWSARRKRYCILGGINLLFQFFISVSQVVSSTSDYVIKLKKIRR